MEEILNELGYGSATRYYYLAEGIEKAVRIVEQRIDMLKEVEK